MKKIIVYMLMIGLFLGQAYVPLRAQEIDVETVREKLNSDMEIIYKKKDYYSKEDLHIYEKDQIRGPAEQMSYIPAYGEPSGSTQSDNKEREFLGKSSEGEPVPNPQYGWDSGWDGTRIAYWGMKEPWDKGYCKENKYDNGKEFNVPGIGKTSLEAAIQTGVDLVYGNKTYLIARGSGPLYSTEKNNSHVHKKGEKPVDGWVKHVHIIIPPTDKTWGQGRIYKPGGYMGIPIAPFELLGPDLEVEMVPSSFSKPYHQEDMVSVSSTVYSTYDKEEETSYEWIIKGTKTNKVYTTTGTYAGYSDGGKSTGTETVPPSIKGKTGSLPAVFDVTFQMPDEEVEVLFKINKKGDKPKEVMLDNNVASIIVPWEPYTITKANYYLDYNELSKEFQHEIAGGSVSGSVTLPKGWWKENSDGELTNTTGSLNITTVTNPNALLNVNYSNNRIEDTSLSVSEPSSDVTKYPILTATIDRSSFGDNPSSIFKPWPNVEEPCVKAFQSKHSGPLSKEYEWEESREGTRTGSDGKPETYTYYVTLGGTAAGKFAPDGTDKLDIGVYIYNGMKNMPHVAERDFKKEIDDNETDSLKKTIWWESERYEMNVQRFMSRTYLDTVETQEEEGPIEKEERVEWEAVNGQYKRIFTGQNKAEITWGVTENMEGAYKDNRKNAKNKVKSKSAYDKVPFSTDRELQSYEYPFKSGYYFNPAGTYTFTISTEIYKDIDEPTKEHKDLVEELINAFRYTSTMAYKIDGSNRQLVLQAESISSELEKYLEINQKDYHSSERLQYSSVPNQDEKTDVRYKQILEGYSESNTEGSKEDYKYKEYIREGDIFFIKETTIVTIFINPENIKLYTYGGMKDKTYHITAWVEDIDVTDITRVPKLVLKGVKEGSYLDHIPVTVKGSMYDDLNN